jgi:5-methyltetrahydrofolate--homocysteine methyltransferase
VKAASPESSAAVRRDRAPLPIQAQVTLDTSGRMLLGTDIASAMTTLEALKVDVIGLNCSTGPRAHARADPLPVRARDAALVGAFRTPGCRSTPGRRRAVYPLEPEPMATRSRSS